jgi:cell division protein FtsI/penicillin-binding protein 2
VADRMFERRLKIFIFFWVVAAGLLITRLGYLQIIKGEQYIKETDNPPHLWNNGSTQCVAVYRTVKIEFWR